MLNFNFKNQTEILFGKGQIKEAKSRLPQDARVLLLYGGGSIKRNGVYDDVLTLLNGIQYEEFSGVEPNPTLETLMQASPAAVTRERLEQALWGESPPDNDMLRSHIYELRRSVDGAAEVKLIHTLPRVGYRLGITAEGVDTPTEAARGHG